MITMVCYRAAKTGIITGVLLAIARISGETAPLLFTALSNQFMSLNMNGPMANLPVVIYQYAASLQGLEQSGLGRGHADHAAGAGHQHPCPQHVPQIRTARRLAQLAGRSLGNQMENTATAVKNKIEVKNLNFYYGKFHAIRNVNMSIQEKKVTAFIGPSGCGKSTLLRTFNRMFELYPGQRAEGEIILDGENLLTAKTDISLIRAKVGMVFQKPTPFPMSIYDNIAFGVRLFERLSKGEMDERVEWALSKAALWNEVKDKLHQSGNNLSGGQQQRLCIARGVAIKPEVLLLDEPCSALDPISTAKIEELIAELKNDYTVVIVTHNMQQAARCSDYTAYMYLGELMEFGQTDQIFVKPARKGNGRLHHRPLRLMPACAGAGTEPARRPQAEPRSPHEQSASACPRRFAISAGRPLRTVVRGSAGNPFKLSSRTRCRSGGARRLKQALAWSSSPRPSVRLGYLCSSLA